MDARVVLRARGFTASSGNRIVAITDLGPDGMHAAWDAKPTGRDMSELEEWVAAMLTVPTAGVTRHNGSRKVARHG